MFKLNFRHRWVSVRCAMHAYIYTANVKQAVTALWLWEANRTGVTPCCRWCANHTQPHGLTLLQVFINVSLFLFPKKTLMQLKVFITVLFFFFGTLILYLFSLLFFTAAIIYVWSPIKENFRYFLTIILTHFVIIIDSNYVAWGGGGGP